MIPMIRVINDPNDSSHLMIRVGKVRLFMGDYVINNEGQHEPAHLYIRTHLLIL